MSHAASDLVSVQQLVIEISKLERRHYFPGIDRLENLSEHSMAVALLAWFLHQKVKSETDLGKVVRYALVHDAVEVHAGDFNTYATAAERSQKARLERESLEKIAAEFGNFPDMVETMRAYQGMADRESVFVWTVDKMQAMLMAQMDNWRTHREQNISYESFSQKISELRKNVSPELKHLFDEVAEWCKQTY